MVRVARDTEAVTREFAVGIGWHRPRAALGPVRGHLHHAKGEHATRQVVRVAIRPAHRGDAIDARIRGGAPSPCILPWVAPFGRHRRDADCIDRGRVCYRDQQLGRMRNLDLRQVEHARRAARENYVPSVPARHASHEAITRQRQRLSCAGCVARPPVLHIADGRAGHPNLAVATRRLAKRPRLPLVPLQKHRADRACAAYPALPQA